MAITKKDGSVYEPSFLSSFQRSVVPCWNNENSTVNIFQDPELAKSRGFSCEKNTVGCEIC